VSSKRIRDDAQGRYELLSASGLSAKATKVRLCAIVYRNRQRQWKLPSGPGMCIATPSTVPVYRNTCNTVCTLPLFSRRLHRQRYLCIATRAI